jgi:hypothetical protein
MVVAVCGEHDVDVEQVHCQRSITASWRRSELSMNWPKV